MGQEAARAEIAVIGGSGLYAFLDGGLDSVAAETPYGPPSDPIVLGEVHGRRVAFLPRHGRDHRFPPHAIPYRANLYALRALGVGQILAPCAVGSLRPDLAPGTLVVPDQLIDRTSGRPQTYHDRGAVHVSFADPYCPLGRAAVLRTAARAPGQGPAGPGPGAHDGGTMVVVEGPRFSTRAESRAYAAMGGDLINMTGHPEAVLARELGLCYTALALVTDYDAGVDASGAVTQHEVFTTFAAHTERVRTLLLAAIAELPKTRDCGCAAFAPA